MNPILSKQANAAAGAWMSQSSQLAASSFQEGPARLTPLARIIVAAALFLGLRNHGGDLQVTPTGVDRNKRQIGGADVLAIVVQIIFYPDFYTNLHRAVEHAIHGRTQDHEIADVHWHKEIQMIN